MSRSAALGDQHTIDLPAGPLSYRERGTGRPVVFVHGFLVNGDLWRKVVPQVAGAGFRCVVPDLPLGAHGVAMRPDADLSPPGLARLIAAFLDALDLDDVVLVANDTGGALAQLVMTEHPERLGGVVLTNCDAFERFFPPLFRYLQLLPKVPGAVALMGKSVRLGAVGRSPLAFGTLTHTRIDDDAMASYTEHARRRDIQRDIKKMLAGVHKRYTLEAARRLDSFDKPVLLAWGVDDPSFRIAEARRLAEVLPHATVVPVEASRTFVSEDQPEVLAGLIVDFARETTGARR